MRRVFLVLSILGLLFGLFEVIVEGFIPRTPFMLLSSALVVICGIYIVYFVVTNAQTQKAQELPRQTGTSQRQINFLVQELQLYDTENRLIGGITSDGTLYGANWHDRGRIPEINQDGCVVENKNESRVVFVKHDGRISSLNGSLGRVDPSRGLVYKHDREGRQVRVVGKVSPLGDTYRMGAVASLLLSPYQMGK